RLRHCPALGQCQPHRLGLPSSSRTDQVGAPHARILPEATNSRFARISDESTRMAWVTDSVFATDGQTLDRRFDEWAGSVCDADPRSREQRRADALGALAAGAERLVC